VYNGLHWYEDYADIFTYKAGWYHGSWNQRRKSDTPPPQIYFYASTTCWYLLLMDASYLYFFLSRIFLPFKLSFPRDLYPSLFTFFHTSLGIQGGGRYLTINTHMLIRMQPQNTLQKNYLINPKTKQSSLPSPSTHSKAPQKMDQQFLAKFSKRWHLARALSTGRAGGKEVYSYTDRVGSRHTAALKCIHSYKNWRTARPHTDFGEFLS
jgi:hypothetical protein